MNTAIDKFLYESRETEVAPKTSLDKWAYRLCERPKYQIMLYLKYGWARGVETRLWVTGCGCWGCLDNVLDHSREKLAVRYKDTDRSVNWRFILLPFTLLICNYCKIIFLLRFPLSNLMFVTGPCFLLWSLLRFKDVSALKIYQSCDFKWCIFIVILDFICS